MITPTSIKASLSALTKQGFLVLVILLLIVIVSSGALISINFYTIKILSALRAYINGESRYSKAQKDGAHHLLMYMGTRDEVYYSLYKDNFSVNLGDSLARVGLNEGDAEINISRNFVAGQNDTADVESMIWLVQNFRNISFLQHGIAIWTAADKINGSIDRKADSVHTLIRSGKASTPLLNKTRLEIDSLNSQLTQAEAQFSDVLGEASRQIGRDLFWANIAMTLLIVGATGIYSAISIRKLIRSQSDIYSQNQVLTETNKELDRFVYSASHDLRAPLTSLKGLLQIIREEEDPEEISHYLKLMDESLQKQDDFIREIIDYSRNKRIQVSVKTIDLARLIDEAYAQHQYLSSSADLLLQKELQVLELNTDPLRLKIIINNLISNAIKYCDMEKAIRFVIVRTDMLGSNVRIQVVDNGIGISEKYLDKIFDMFFVTQHSNRGSGVGLYITKESIEKIKGSITVKSEPGRGTTFTVVVPLNLKLPGEEGAEQTVRPWPSSRTGTWLN